MRKLKNIFSLLLAFTLCFSACTKTPEESSQSSSTSEIVGSEENENPYAYVNELGTVHEAKITSTNYDLVKNGKSDYVIVYPKEMTDNESRAVNELVYFYSQATGIRLTSLVDAEADWDINATYLSVGETALLSQAGVEPNFVELGESGYIVQTSGKSVFMVGGYFGSLYAVYDFLSRQFNFEIFSKDEIRLDTGVENEKLLDIEVKEIPDIEYRVSAYGELNDDNTARLRMRMNSFDEVWLELGGNNQWWHNFFGVLPKETYQEAHPTWYSPDGKQLCLSRDPDGMLNEVKKQVFDLLENNKNLHYFTFTQMDENVWCDCSKCTESLKKYGCNSAVYIKFINKLAKEVKAWVNANAPGRPVKVGMFAYMQTTDAPVKKDANGNYVPFDNDVILEDNVAIFYAPVYDCYYVPVNAERNKLYNETMQKWNALAKTTFLWTYSTNFYDYLSPYDTIDATIGNARFAVENNAVYYYDQAQWSQDESTDWGNLKYYLQSKLQWNCQLPAEQLINDWFAHYFKSAAKPMREMFDFYRTWWAYLMDEFDLRMSYRPDSVLSTKDAWPYNTLNKMLSYVDKAYESIEAMQRTDPETYGLLSNRIKLEGIAYRYLRMSIHSGMFTSAEYNEEFEAFKADCTVLKINNYFEGAPISDLYNILKK